MTVMIMLLSLEAHDCLAICCTVPRIVPPAIAKRIHRCFSLCQTGNWIYSRWFSLLLIHFLSLRLFRARFFLSNGTKKAPRAVRGNFSASFDDMILTHFCKVCIRVFRHDSDDCAFLLGSTWLPRYLLHCYADSFTCCCQAHTQVFQSLPNRKLNLFSIFLCCSYISFLCVSLAHVFFYRMVRKEPLAPCQCHLVNPPTSYAGRRIA